VNLELTFFQGLTKPIGELRAVNWHDFCETKPLLIKSKEHAPLYSCTVFRNNHRLEANVVSKSAIVLDFENKPNQHRITTLDDIFQEFKDYTFFAHSSFSNTADLPRFRVVIPFSEHVSPAKWPYVFGGFYAKFAHLHGLDLSCKSASRAFFYPAASESNIEIYQSIANSGFFFEPEEIDHRLLQVTETVKEEGRNNKLVAMATAKLNEQVPFEAIVLELVEYDRNHHKNPLFVDVSEGYRNGAETGAAKLVLNVAKSLGINPFERPTVVEFIPEKPEEPKIRPLSKALLNPPGLVGDLAKYILDTAIKPQPELALAAAFSACGTLMGRKIQTQWGNRTNLYFLCLAETGAGKDHMRSVIKNAYTHCSLEARIIEDLASEVGLVSSLAIEPSSVMLVDEFGKFLHGTREFGAQHLYAINRLLLTLYSSSNQLFVGKKYKQAENNIVIQEPCLNLMGITTPRSFFKNITDDSLEDGFLNRFICLQSSSQNPKSAFKPLQALPPSIRERFEAWAKVPYAPGGNLQTVGHIRPIPRIVFFEHGVSEMFEQFENQEVWKLRESSNEYAPLYQRCNENALRLALVLAGGIDHEAPLITERCAQYAISFVRETTNNFKILLQENITENKLARDKKRVLRFVDIQDHRHPKKYITTGIIKKNFDGFTSEYLKCILNDLTLEEKLIAKPASKLGGRPSLSYRPFKYGNVEE
jgi:hypothetical protein